MGGCVRGGMGSEPELGAGGGPLSHLWHAVGGTFPEKMCYRKGGPVSQSVFSLGEVRELVDGVDGEGEKPAAKFC